MIDRLIEPDLIEQMKKVCLCADERGMDLRHTYLIRQIVENYESGVWERWDENKKLLYIQSIDNGLYGQPGEVYVFESYFTSSEEHLILANFTSLLHQYYNSFSYISVDPVSKDDIKVVDTLPETLLTSDEKEFNALLNSIPLAPEMGDQFMVVCLYFKNLLVEGDWCQLNAAEKMHCLKFFDTPQIHTDIARHASGAKISKLLERIKQRLEQRA